MPALCRADGPRASHISGLGGNCIVFSLAKGAPDGMNRRQVQHVESHLGHIGQPRFAIRKVPWTPGSAAAERGNISYHDAKRAFSRSTTTTQFPLVNTLQRLVWIAPDHLQHFRRQH